VSEKDEEMAGTEAGPTTVPVGQASVLAKATVPVGQASVLADATVPVGQASVLADATVPVGQASVLADARVPVGQASVLARECGPSRARTYAGVIAVEALVIAALWWFSRHFSA
jgi:hypothetical protein